MDLRSLGITLGFNIRSSPLQDINISLDEIIRDSGKAEKELKDIGDQAVRTGKEGSKGIDNLGSSIDDLADRAGQAFSIIQRGFAGGVILGFTRDIFNAASNVQMLDIQLSNAARSAEEWAGFQNTINDVYKKTKGMMTGGEFMEIAQKAESAGMSLESFGKLGGQAIVTSIAKGRDFASMMEVLNNTIQLGDVRTRAFLQTVGINLEEELSKSGITLQKFKDNMSAAQREQYLFNILSQQAEKNMGAFNDVLDSAGGTTIAFDGALGDMMETMGEPILKPITLGMRTITDLFTKMQESEIGKKGIELVGIGIAVAGTAIAVSTLFAGFKMLLPVILPILAPMLKIGAIVGIIALAGEDLILAFQGVDDTLTATVFNGIAKWLGFETTFADVRDSIISGIEDIKGFFAGMFDDPVAWAKGKLEDLKGFALIKFNEIKSGFLNSLGSIFGFGSKGNNGYTVAAPSTDKNNSFGNAVSSANSTIRQAVLRSNSNSVFSPKYNINVSGGKGDGYDVSKAVKKELNRHSKKMFDDYLESLSIQSPGLIER